MTERAPAEKVHEHGPQCPRCHCRHLPVQFTRRRGNLIIRTRECRNCGARMRTIEHEVDDNGHF